MIRRQSFSAVCSHNWLQSMALPCPKKHVHKPFTLQKTPTGWQFDTAKEGEYPELLCTRYSDCILKHVAPATNQASVASRVPSNAQQTKRHLQLVPEYHRVVYASIPPSFEHKPFVPLNGGENGAKAKYGIYHTPEQFIRFAKT